MIYRRAAGSEPGYAWLASCQLDASRCEATAPRPSRSRQPVPRRPRPRTGRRSPAPAPAAEGALARSHPGFGSLSWTATRARSSKIISYCPSSDADERSEGAPSRPAMSTTVTDIFSSWPHRQISDRQTRVVCTPAFMREPRPIKGRSTKTGRLSSDGCAKTRTQPGSLQDQLYTRDAKLLHLDRNAHCKSNAILLQVFRVGTCFS